MYSLRGCRLAVISLFILWTALYSALKAYVAPKFTATSHNPSMAAFCGVCLVNMMWITFLGFRAWPSVPKSEKNGLSLWKTNAAGQELAIIQCAFQGWDLAMCFFLPEANFRCTIKKMHARTRGYYDGIPSVSFCMLF